jgi:hypothetical protein
MPKPIDWGVARVQVTQSVLSKVMLNTVRFPKLLSNCFVSFAQIGLPTAELSLFPIKILMSILKPLPSFNLEVCAEKYSTCEVRIRVGERAIYALHSKA